MVDQILIRKIKNTKQQWFLLIILCIVIFLSAMIYSIQAPFYPAEAENKMATPSEYGFVLGTFGLTQFILGPIFGTYLLKVGVKNAFHGGIAVASISVMTFGFLNYISDHYAFVVLSFFLRILEASGALAMSIATYTFVAIDFPGSIGRTFATVETVYGFGLSLGPSAGVILFNIGGFTLPFVTLGFIYFLVGGLTYFILPKSTKLKKMECLNENENENIIIIGDRKALGFIGLLKIPGVSMCALAIIYAIQTSQFILGTILEPNLRQFNLNSTMFSVMFLLQGLTQAIFSIVWGFICDRISKPEFVTLLGSVLLTISSFSIGPFVYLPIEPAMGITAGSLVGIGLGSSAILVSAFLVALKETKNYGFPVNESTSGLVSGLFMSSISFGGFCGPLIAGIFYDHYGFRIATSILFFLNLIFTMAFGLFICMKKPSPIQFIEEDLSYDGEKIPLISNSVHLVST